MNNEYAFDMAKTLTKIAEALDRIATALEDESTSLVHHVNDRAAEITEELKRIADNG